MDAMDERIEKLERSVCRFRLTGGAIVCLGVVGLVMGQAAPTSNSYTDVIRARSFSVVDGNGNVRATFEYNSKADAVALEIGEGKNHIIIAASEIITGINIEGQGGVMGLSGTGVYIKGQEGNVDLGYSGIRIQGQSGSETTLGKGLYIKGQEGIVFLADTGIAIMGQAGLKGNNILIQNETLLIKGQEDSMLLSDSGIKVDGQAGTVALTCTGMACKDDLGKMRLIMGAIENSGHIAFFDRYGKPIFVETEAGTIDERK